MSAASPFSWKSSARSDVGVVRDMNEDAFLELTEIGLWVVADGMGGHSAGDIASGGIVETLSTVPEIHTLAGSVDDIELRLVQLNTRLREIAAKQDVHTIGSTVVALVAAGRHCVCLWAGDSRIYRFRNGELEQLTQDHAFVEELVEKGVLRPEEAAGHPQSNLVTRAVGAGETLHLDLEIFDIEEDDQFILCSDGLDKELPAEDIAKLAETELVENLSDALVELTVERGARDNVTVVCMQVIGPTDTSLDTVAG
jgi:protein phosphatase